MADLREQLERCLQGRVCLMGLGNVVHGDDGFGVRLVERMKPAVHSPRSTVHSPQSTAQAKTSEGGLSDCGLWTVDCGLYCCVAGTAPERFVGFAAQRGFDHLVFVDAVDFGGMPGSVILLNSEQMESRFPQISTHKISLGLLAKWVEANGATRAWLLGVQPESLKPGTGLSPIIERTLETLRQLLSTARMNGAMNLFTSDLTAYSTTTSNIAPCPIVIPHPLRGIP